jgi:hypothetical protein
MTVNGHFHVVETLLSEKDIPLALHEQHKRKVVRVVPGSSVILLSITELSFMYFYNKKDKQLISFYSPFYVVMQRTAARDLKFLLRQLVA